MTAANDRKQDPEILTPEGATIKIDRDEYFVPWQEYGKILLTGMELRRIPEPPIDEKRDLFEVVPGGSDRKIEDDEKLEIRDGMRFFTAPRQINPGHGRPGAPLRSPSRRGRLSNH